jgi:hypothetical protein
LVEKYAQPADISSSKFDYNNDEKQTNKNENHLNKRKIAYSVVKNAQGQVMQGFSVENAIRAGSIFNQTLFPADLQIGPNT